MVSSTRIRGLLRDGQPGRANALLGRLHSVTGEVVRGDRVGAALGYPTANVAVDPHRCLPATGIYATWIRLRDTWHRAATSVGYRPTFGGTTLTVEAHVLDFSGDLYGVSARLAFARRLRGERRFASAAALSVQIGRDIDRVRAILANAEAPS
jgi:riboflavin kinase/FMN adenylyltransferase